MNAPSAEPEAGIRAAFERGDHERAATLAIERYGEEIFAFLVGRLRDRADASEVFSMFAEELWVSLPRFEWRSSLRSWAYTIARRAAYRFATAPHRRAQRNIGLSQVPRLSELVDRVRTATAAYRRTETKSRMRELRQRLPPDDQTLLVLRVDRGFSWREVTAIMTEDPERGADADVSAGRAGVDLDKEAARLRQHFQRVKARLRAMAEEEGLLE